MGKLDTELFILKIELNSFYDTNTTSDSMLLQRIIDTKLKIHKISNRKSRINKLWKIDGI